MVKQVSRRPAHMKPEPQNVQPHHAKYGSGKDQGGRLHREGQEIGTGCSGEEYPMIFIHMNILKETSQHNKLQQPRNQIRLGCERHIHDARHRNRQNSCHNSRQDAVIR